MKQALILLCTKAKNLVKRLNNQDFNYLLDWENFKSREMSVKWKRRSSKKVHVHMYVYCISWEGHQIWNNLPILFDITRYYNSITSIEIGICFCGLPGILNQLNLAGLNCVFEAMYLILESTLLHIIGIRI